MTDHHHLDPGEAMYELGVDPKGKKKDGEEEGGLLRDLSVVLPGDK